MNTSNGDVKTMPSTSPLLLLVFWTFFVCCFVFWLFLVAKFGLMNQERCKNGSTKKERTRMEYNKRNIHEIALHPMPATYCLGLFCCCCLLASSCFITRNDCKPSPLISFDYLYGGFVAIWAAGQHSINKRFHFSFILTVATSTNWKKKKQKPKDIQYYWN